MQKKGFTPLEIRHRRYLTVASGNLSLTGFTIVELVMVLVIVGVLSIVIMTDLNLSLKATRLEAVKWKLKSDLIYAQGLSVTQQVNHGIIFDPSQETYSVYRQNTSDIINDPLTKQPFTVNYLSESNFKGIELVSISFDSNWVEFDSYGRPSDGAGFLTNDGTVTLSNGSASVSITVTKNTGKVN